MEAGISTPKVRLPGRVAVWKALLALAALVLLWFACGQPLYSLYDEQGGPYYLTIQSSDWDLDGDLDVLVHNMRQPMEFLAWSGGALWTNQGGLQGGPLGRFSYRLSDLEGGRASVLVDFDGDGDPDLLVYDGWRLDLAYNQAGVQAGKPGVFKLWATFPPPDVQVGQYGLLLAGDVDGDGRNDAVLLGRGQSVPAAAGSSRDNLSWIWLNQINSHGVYSKTTTIIADLNGLSVAAAALADLDGDGDLDLLAAASPTRAKSMLGSEALVLINDGVGQFSDSGQRFAAKAAASVALADLDGDGDPDALVGYRRGALLLINQGGDQSGIGGAYALGEQTISGKNIRAVSLADLDGDGDPDALVVGNQSADLWWNDGGGRFTQASRSFPAREDENLTVGDFNNDGRQDIFIAQYDQTARLWWNRGGGTFSP